LRARARRRFDNPIPAQFEAFGQCFKGTRRDPEHIVAGATQNATNGLTRDASASRNPFDRRAITMESDDMLVYLVPLPPPFPLKLLCRRQQSRIDSACAQSLPDLAHVTPYGIDESGAGVLKQMPAIGHLQRMRDLTARDVAVSTAAIARDDLDVAVVAEPGRDRRHLAIGQQIDHMPTFEIADDRAISMIATPNGPFPITGRKALKPDVQIDGFWTESLIELNCDACSEMPHDASRCATNYHQRT
jgi:hypothetical protein